MNLNFLEDENQRKKHLFCFFAFIIFSVAIYFPSLLGDPFWDDWVFIFKSVSGQMHTPSPLAFFPGGKYAKSWPLFFTFLWVMLKVFKDHYIYYHWVNLIFHGINGYLCWKMLEKIKVKNAFLIALIYIAHPLQLFTVSWIIQIKTILSTFFFLISLNFLIDAYIKEKKTLVFFSILFFIFSIFTKSTTVAFGACLLFIYPVIKEKISFKKYLFYFLIPFIFLSAVATVRTAWSFNIRDILSSAKIGTPEYYTISVYNFPYSEDILQPGEVPFEQLTAADRTILSTKSFLRYTLFTIFPFEGQHLFQKKTEMTYFSLELLYLVSGVIFLYYFISYLVRNKLHREYLGLTFFTAAMLPFCGMVYIPIYSISNFVPYWLSIPLLGLLPLTSYLIKSSKVLIGIIVIFAAVSHWQSYEFINTDEIFVESIKEAPDTQVYQIALIEHYVFTNQCKRALDLYQNFKENNFTSMFCLDIKTSTCGKK
jgi:hypothetical protein